MTQAQHHSAQSTAVEPVRLWSPSGLRGNKPADTLERAAPPLAFPRNRLTLLRMRASGIDCIIADILIRRTLGHLGYTGMLPNGDILFVHVANFGVTDEDAHDASIERDLIELLSEHLAEHSADGLDMTLKIAVAHMWSDEDGDESRDGTYVI